MIIICPECGAAVPEGGSCREDFDSLLLLEWQVPGGPGEATHFLAVSAYILQHPDSMRFTAEALRASRQNVAELLAGTITLEQIRRRVRQAADGPRRITRRDGDPVVRWPVESWPLNVTDVLAGGADDYGNRVARWASSILQALDAAGA